MNVRTLLSIFVVNMQTVLILLVTTLVLVGKDSRKMKTRDLAKVFYWPNTKPRVTFHNNDR